MEKYNLVFKYAAAAAKSLQLCPALCDRIDGSPPDSPTPGILQARILEWVAISFSNEWKRKVKVKSLSRVRRLATPWTAVYQALSSTGFSRQEYWSGLPIAFSASSMSMPQIVINLTSSGHMVCILQVCFILCRKKCIMVHRLNNCESTNHKWPWKYLLWGGLYNYNQ